jgi:hypothetical protein
MSEETLYTYRTGIALPDGVAEIARAVAELVHAPVTELIIEDHRHEGLRPGAYSIAFEGAGDWPVTYAATASPPAGWLVEAYTSWCLAVYPVQPGASTCSAPERADPAVTPARPADETVFAWASDGAVCHGNVADLARWAVAEQIGYADEPVPTTVYAPTDTGALAPVPVRVKCGPFDGDNWATLTVTVDLGSGVTATAVDRVDGRA